MTKGWPQPQQVFWRPFARYGVNFCMSQARMNDEGDDRGNQREAEGRRDVELRRPRVAETKRGLYLPHDLLLTSTAPFLNSARGLMMRFDCRRIHQTEGQRGSHLGLAGVVRATNGRDVWRVSALRRGRQAQFRRHIDEVGQGVGFHLAHHPAAMRLYGNFADPQLEADLLVQPADDDQG